MLFLEKLNTWLAKYILYILLIFGLVLLYLQHRKDVAEIKRVSNNIEVLNGNNEKSVKLVIGELSKYDKKIDSIREEFGIKERNIKNIVSYKYNVKDTTVQSFVIHHVNAENRFFKATLKNKHYSIFETVKDTSVTLDSLFFNDNNTLFIYNKRPKWFWKINKFWKPKFLTAKLYSDFKKDTIAIDRIYTYDK